MGDLEYNLNVCRNVVHELWNVGDLENVGAVVTHSQGDFSLGATNSTLIASPGTLEPMLVYSNGSPCSDSDSSASTVIRVCLSSLDCTIASDEPYSSSAQNPSLARGHRSLLLLSQSLAVRKTNANSFLNGRRMSRVLQIQSNSRDTGQLSVCFLPCKLIIPNRMAILTPLQPHGRRLYGIRWNDNVQPLRPRFQGLGPTPSSISSALQLVRSTRFIPAGRAEFMECGRVWACQGRGQ